MAATAGLCPVSTAPAALTQSRHGSSTWLLATRSSLQGQLHSVQVLARQSVLLASQAHALTTEQCLGR
jgi:hypothetical protein